MPVHQMLGMQYQPVHIGNITAQFLVLPQLVAGNSGTYEVRRAVNYDPATGVISSGQAFLYEAVEINSGRKVALKQLLDPVDPDARERHDRECGFTLSGHRHPHIVAGLERFTEGREEFLVMEWVEGATLGQEVARRGPFSRDQIVSHLLTLARVLHFVNVNGFLFRDLNEGNVMETPQGGPIVLDFGGIQPINSQRHTRLLPPSVAPEVALAVATGRQPVFTPASEVYACATIGYLLATAQLVPDNRAAQPLVPPRVFNPLLDPALEALLLHALDARPGRRPATPLALVRLLEALASGNGFASAAVPALPMMNPAPLMPRMARPQPGLPVAGPPVPAASWVAVAAALRRVHQEAAALCTRAYRQALRSLQFPAAGLWRGLAVTLAGTTLALALTLICFLGRNGRVPALPVPLRAEAQTPSGTGTIVVPRPSPLPIATSTSLPVPAARIQPTRPIPPALRPLWVNVAGNRVNLRTRPGLSGTVLGVVSTPKPLRLLGRWNGWYKVAALDGAQGYVWGAFLPVEPTYRRGVLCQPMFLGGNRFPAGEKLLLASVTPAVDMALLPSGQVAPVPAAAVKVLAVGASQAGRQVPPLPFPGL